MKKQTITVKNKKLEVQIAKSKEEHQTGLMHRRSISSNFGMLFVFDREQESSFWMKNTHIPLSIAFIDKNKKIIQIEDLEPGELDPVKSSKKVIAALEVPRGWFKKNEISLGDSVKYNSTSGNKPISIKIIKERS
jgi:uncharacterized membrane protein (UPF0127 family)